MAVTRAGMRVTAIFSDGPRWLDGLVGSGPQASRGPSFRARYPGDLPSVTPTVSFLRPRQIWSESRSPGFIVWITSRSCTLRG